MSLPQILQMLQQNSTGGIQQIKALMGMVRNAGNPQAMIAQMAQSNPQMRQAMDYVNQHGGDPKKAFYALAQQNGIDPDEVLNMLK